MREFSDQMSDIEEKMFDVTKELNYTRIDIGRYEFRVYPGHYFFFIPKINIIKHL